MKRKFYICETIYLLRGEERRRERSIYLSLLAAADMYVHKDTQHLLSTCQRLLYFA